MGLSDAVSGAIKTVEKLNPLGGDEQQDEQRDAQQTAEQAPGSEEARSDERLGEDTEQVRVERAEEELEVEKTHNQLPVIAATLCRPGLRPAVVAV